MQTATISFGERVELASMLVAGVGIYLGIVWLICAVFAHGKKFDDYRN
jgi:hypothetical protein